jgi:hypothetical protein
MMADFFSITDVERGILDGKYIADGIGKHCARLSLEEVLHNILIQGLVRDDVERRES